MKINSWGLLILLQLILIYSTIQNPLNAQTTSKNQQEEFSQPGDEFSAPDDEFSSAGDEFSQTDTSAHKSGCGACPHKLECAAAQEEAELQQRRMDYLYWIISVLLFTVIAGFLVRFEQTRNLRGFFLLASLFVLGFYKGGCTACPVDGIQNLVLFFFLPHISWHYLVWFIGIIVITYLFGKVWCGWICHWGALQEFLYLPGRLEWLKGEKVQTVFRYTRLVLLVALIIQLIAMGSKYWCSIDPFAAIFSFPLFLDGIINTPSFDAELWIGITLVLLVLISSVFTYRPFCRSMCPIGLILGWISYIPGAAIVGLVGNCAGCKLCSGACKQDAIIRKDKFSIMRNTECIACGDCMTACNRKGLEFVRKSKKHPSKFKCENECTLHNK